MSEIFGKIDPEGLKHAGAVTSASEDGCDFGIFFPREGIYHGMVAHELFHVTHRIMESIGEKFDIEHQEPHAYLLEWLTNWTYVKLEEAGVRP